MSTLCAEHASANKESIIRELLEGKECASQLKLLFQKPFGPDGTPPAEQLVSRILRSFTQSISDLTSSVAGGEVGQISPISGQSGSPLGTSSCNGRRPDESGQSRKISSPPAKDRRGCYKRRKTADTWTKISHTIEDEHAWRKYGQKEILNSRFPRSYFRCTRKHDQGCKAIKQVQRIQENPEKFLTTYIGSHTCKDILRAPQMVTDYGNLESFLVPPESSKAPIINDDQKVHGRPLISSSSSTPAIKQEYPKEDTPLSEITDNLEPNFWSDLKDFELPEPLKMSTEHNADTVYSCSGGTMDFGVDQPVGFGTHPHLHFD
ncbi:probable WRKY transcription factor 70 isoform X2 [Neltuma alba]|uniref:probable WRKY transcription factor 70 isoform X2 n=1 Tax=Neltuma alba TaxID=207710 RepID=UPI0010A2D438|nr:probable WRKY transcription factor 70 isoform X2 [Prosopis alba]